MLLKEGTPPMPPTVLCDPDPITIERARSGDHCAFSRLVKAYQTPVYNLCYRVLGNPHDAEEAAQEAFLRAYTRLVSYDPARSFKTWLLSIAHHYCIDRLRRRRLNFLSLDDEPALDTAMWRSTAPTPEEVVMCRERDGDVQALLNALPLKDRSALVMRYWYDLSYEEIAAATDTTVSAVKSRLHRARETLAVEVSEPGSPRSARTARGWPQALAA
jgi:RNA polymerase sigma-70 factor (ECF subfamily)